MTSSEDLAARIAEVTKVIAAVSWRWDRTFWDNVAASLQYEWSHGYVYAYFKGDVLQIVAAEVAFYSPPEELSAAEYDELSDAYYAKYQAGVAVIEKILGKPEFDDGGGGARIS